MQFTDMVRQQIVLANVWDLASLRIAESLGYQAVATSSGAIAWSLGLPDGSTHGRPLLDRARAICQAARVPVTVDIERGYSDSPEEVAKVAAEISRFGAYGLNIEDSVAGTIIDTTEQRVLITSVCNATQEASDFVVNARCDLALTGIPLTHGTMPVYEERIQGYLEAGADQVFLPGVLPVDELSQLTGRYPGVLNTMALGVSETPEKYLALGVTRVSLGTGPCEAAQEATRKYYRDMANFTLESDATLDYGAVNALFEK